MAKEREVKTSVVEDFKALGMEAGLDDDTQARLAGLSEITEDAVVTGGVPRLENMKMAPLEEESESDEQLDEDAYLDSDTVTVELFERIKGLPFDLMSEEDRKELLDKLREKTLPEDNEELKALAEEVVGILTASPDEESFVTSELLNRIKDLPFDLMSEEDFDELLEELSKKTLAEDAEDELKELAEEVATLILEGKKKKKGKKQSKSGSKKKKKGKRETIIKDGKKAVVYRKRGAEKKKAAKKGKIMRRKKKSQIKKTKKKAKKVAKRAGSASAKTARAHKRKGESVGESSDLAKEIRALLNEGIEEEVVVEEYTMRDEIIERIGNIFELIENQIDDEEVVDIMVEQLEKIQERDGNDELTESAMSDEDFQTELRPSLLLIRSCYKRIEDGVPNEDDLLGNLRALASNE